MTGSSHEISSSWADALALGALAACASAGALLWVIGGVAGLVFGGGWPAVTPLELVAVAFSLGSHLSDPRMAWPPAARDELPGAVPIYLVGIIVVGLAGAASVWIVGRLRGDRKPSGASWASARDLRTLRIRQPTPGRLTLGRHAGRLVAAEPRQSVLVVAPTQTGKTSGLAVPAILEWRGPVLATSVKTDPLRDTLERRLTLGRVDIFDPAESRSERLLRDPRRG
jgi:type IV secretion system protein VirD4